MKRVAVWAILTAGVLAVGVGSQSQPAGRAANMRTLQTYIGEGAPQQSDGGDALYRGRASFIAGPARLRGQLPELGRYADEAVEDTRAWLKIPAVRMVLVEPTGDTGFDQLAGSVSTHSGNDAVRLNAAVWPALTDVGKKVVLRHEIAHVALRAASRREVPRWIHEGVATYLAYHDSGIAPLQVLAIISGEPQLPPDQGQLGQWRLHQNRAGNSNPLRNKQIQRYQAMLRQTLTGQLPPLPPDSAFEADSPTRDQAYAAAWLRCVGIAAAGHPESAWNSQGAANVVRYFKNAADVTS